MVSGGLFMSDQVNLLPPVIYKDFSVVIVFREERYFVSVAGSLIWPVLPVRIVPSLPNQRKKRDHFGIHRI